MAPVFFSGTSVDTFENCVPHSLDIEICPGIYHKNTQTDQYKNIESFTLWKYKNILDNISKLRNHSN